MDCFLENRYWMILSRRTILDLRQSQVPGSLRLQIFQAYHRDLDLEILGWGSVINIFNKQHTHLTNMLECLSLIFTLHIAVNRSKSLLLWVLRFSEKFRHKALQFLREQSLIFPRFLKIIVLIRLFNISLFTVAFW